jgi:ATP phosphoribosyltransferase-like protein
LKIIAELLESCPQLIANNDAWQDPWKKAKIEQIQLLLQGALSAENKVGIKLNVPEADLDKIVQLIPSITAPTIATLYQSCARGVVVLGGSVIAENGCGSDSADSKQGGGILVSL